MRVLDTRMLQALLTRTLATLTVPGTKMTLPDEDFQRASLERYYVATVISLKPR